MAETQRVPVLIRTVEDMQARAEAVRQAGRRLALVPTMGALHEGHAALVRAARRQADHVTVSIFVNPTQFEPGTDLERYPRDLEGDREKLGALGVDVIFAPEVEAIYPGGGPAANRTWVGVEKLDEHLCGRRREGHFRGVTTVVARLFNLCRPHVAVFGEKDAQQLVIIRRMAADLHFGTDIVGVPTQREADGLACSSRNAYLNEEERAQAVVLSRAVQTVERCVRTGEQRSKALVEAMLKKLDEAPLARVEYAEVVDAAALQPVDRIAPGQEVLAAGAVYFGDTRLIDSTFVKAPQ